RVAMFRRGTPASEFLGAKAVVIRPSGEGHPLAICRLDLVMCDGRIRERVLRGVADLGVADETLVLCATHTHSGMGGFTETPLACALAVDHGRPEVEDRVV